MQKKKILIVACLFLSVTSMAGSYGGNVVLPQILTALDAMSNYSLFTTMGSMGMMLALPLVGILCSKFGTKVVTLSGILLMFVVRIAIIFISNPILFGILWAAQGFLSGLFVSSPYTIMAEVVTDEERPKYYGFITAASAAGGLAGPYLTGLVIDMISIYAGLLVWFIFAIIPITALLVYYPNKRNEQKRKFDFAGLILLVAFVFSLVIWLNLGGKLFPYISLPGIGLPVIAVTALITMIKIEMKKENPAVPVRMFRYNRFRSVFIVQALIVAYSTCISAYGIVYAQTVMKVSTTLSSTVTMPQTIVQLILGLFIGGLVGKNFKKRFRPAALLALLAYLAGLIIFSTLSADSPFFILYLATGIGGIGQAVTQSVYAPFFQTQLKKEEIASAQGMYQFASTGGSCIFVALCGACINAGFTLNQAFMLGAGFVALALIIAVSTFRFPKSELVQTD